MTSIWTFVGVAASVAAALPWDGASSTDSVVAVESPGWMPILTQPPLAPHGGEMVPMPGKNIFARAFKDQLCGYLNGNPDSEWICYHSLASCTTSSGVLGCCNPVSTGTGCRFETTCIGAVEQSSCGVGCLSNTHIRKCTDSAAPFCILYTDTDGDLSVWDCATSSGPTGSILVNPAITMASEPSVEVVSRTSSTVPSLTHHASASVPSDSELSQPTMTGDSTKPNVGAISGSVIGGLAVVVLGGLGLFLVLSLRKKNAAAAAALGQTACLMPQHQNHQTKDSEVTTPVNGTPQYNAQPPQQQYYPPQQQGYYAQQPQQPPTELSDGQ